MRNDDIDNVDSVISESGVWSHKRESWYRLKKELEELSKTPTNTTKDKIKPCTNWVIKLLNLIVGIIVGDYRPFSRGLKCLK